MNKDKWIEEIIKSTKTIDTVNVNPSLYEIIKKRLDEKPAIQIVSVKWMYAAAVATGLLMALNISTWKTISKSSEENREPSYRSEFSLTGNNTYSLNY